MSTTIRGLHVCKPQNAPTVGQVKFFLVQEVTSAKGTQYTKIKNEQPDKGGSPFTVMSVAKTNYTDANGNISFNIEIEPAQAPQPTPYPPVQYPQDFQNSPPQQHDFRQNYRQDYPESPSIVPEAPVQRSAPPPAMDTPEQHIMRSANLYCSCYKVAATVVRDMIGRCGFEPSTEDIRQVATTLYIDAKQAGYIAHMNDKEAVKNNKPF